MQTTIKVCVHPRVFAGEQLTHLTGDSRYTVELNETPGDHCYWEEIKGNGCKYYRNVVTNRYLGKHRHRPLLNKRNRKCVKNVFFFLLNGAK